MDSKTGAWNRSNGNTTARVLCVSDGCYTGMNLTLNSTNCQKKVQNYQLKAASNFCSNIRMIYPEGTSLIWGPILYGPYISTLWLNLWGILVLEFPLRDLRLWNPEYFLISNRDVVDDVCDNDQVNSSLIKSNQMKII